MKKTVYGDGIYYVNWLSTHVIPNNKYAIGPAILWSPFYLWTHTFLRGDGSSFPYQFIIGLTSVLYVITGLILLYRLLISWTKPIIAAITTALIALATHLLFYGAIDPVNSHGLSFFAAVLFLTFLFQKQILLGGATLGLIALIRPQDAIYGILLFPFLNKKTMLPILIGFLFIFSPQMFIWFTFSGNPFLSPYFTGGEYFSFLTPHLFSVLFSLKNGLFVYTPLFLIAVIGYFLPWGKQQTYKWTSLVVLLLSLYLIASWSTWGQGASYSGRMFIGMLPIITISLSKLLTYFSKKILTPLLMLLIFLIPLSGINYVLILYFLLTHG
ncbi:MAG: hypothetical protein V1917_03800 [Candidatus Gottesmanbacteria bacterium]